MFLFFQCERKHIATYRCRVRCTLVNNSHIGCTLGQGEKHDYSLSLIIGTVVPRLSCACKHTVYVCISVFTAQEGIINIYIASVYLEFHRIDWQHGDKSNNFPQFIWMHQFSHSRLAISIYTFALLCWRFAEERCIGSYQHVWERRRMVQWDCVFSSPTLFYFMNA